MMAKQSVVRFRESYRVSYKRMRRVLRWTRGLSFALVLALLAVTCFANVNWRYTLISAALLMILGGLTGIAQESLKHRDL